MSAQNAAEKGLPVNVDAERFVLGSILLDDNLYIQAAGALEIDDFSLEKHRRIFRRMGDLNERGERIDRITVANELMKYGELESCDGLGYLVSLDDGLPQIPNLDSYVRLVKDRAVLRRIIFASQHMINRAMMGEESPEEILAGAEETLLKLGDEQVKAGLVNPQQILENYDGGINAFLDPSKRVKGISTGFLKLDEMTGGMHPGDLFILAARPSMGKCLAADSEIVLADGSVRSIEQICIERNAELLTVANDGRLQWTSPSAYVDDGLKPVFRVRTRLGRSVDTTLTHPFLTFDGWKKLEDLKPGDTIAVPRSIPVFGTEELSDHRARILGYLLGDGCLTDSTLAFTNSDPRLRDEFIESVHSFGVQVRIEDSAGTRSPAVCVAADPELAFEKRCRFAANLIGALRKRGESDRSLAIELGVSPTLVCQWKQARCVPIGDTSVRLAAALGVSPEELFDGTAEAASHNAKNALTLWLESLGLWGKAARLKFVPDIVFRSRERAVAIFLNRLFATDGWATVLTSGQAQLGFASVSERLGRQVQHLLLRFGIIAALKRRAISYNGARRTAWQIDITHAESIRTFASRIGIFGKERQLERVLAAIEKKRPHTNRDLVPSEVWKQIERAKGTLSWAAVARSIGIDADSLNLHVHRRGMSRGRLARLAEALDSGELLALAASDLYWDRIASIEYLGKKQVYDLTIPETHNFVANDICVHNTAFALNIAQHVSLRNKQTVAIFSLEMSKESLLTRMLCAAARVDSQRFRMGYLSPDERRKLNHSLMELAEAPLYIDDSAGLHLMDMHAKLRRLKQERGSLSMVIVDYLQLMSSRGRVENRNQEVSALSRGLKLMAKELNVPMIVLSQLSRAVETRQGDHRPVLSDLRESGCLTGDTLVTIACTGARIPIRELVGRENICVWAVNLETWRLQPAPVERVFCTGQKPVFRLTTRLGRTIRATANHPFLTFNGWKRLDELTAGERIAVPRHLANRAEPTMTASELALLGHLIGDGCTLPDHAIQYTTKDRDLAELVAALATDVFGDEVAPRIKTERGWLQVYLASTRKHTHGVGSPVADWLKGLGAWGLRSWEKRIPGRVFEQPADKIALFLRHLWATDGCIHVSTKSPIPRVYYATSSHGLALDVQSALLRVGINARVARVSQKGKGRDQFPVQLSGKSDLTAFVNLIGAVGVRKSAVLDQLKSRLEGYRENTNRDVIPREAWNQIVVPGMTAQGITTREFMHRIDTAYCGTSLYRNNLGRERALRVAEAIGSDRLRFLAGSDVYWDEVARIEADGTEEVFDLTVPGLHNFVAADIIVHNSIEQDADVVGFIFREEVYNRDREDLKGLAELIVAKQRNGPVGTVNLVFLHSQTKFENRAEDTGEMPDE
jgi:replicative DNA helicase